MKKLMISLDRNILNKDSIVANRMIEHGKENELFILIPSKQAETFDLSQHVHVVGTGGNKLQQFFRLKKIGKSLIEDNNVEFITTQDPFFLGKVGVWLKKHTRAKTLEVQLHGDFYSSDYYKKSGLKTRVQYYIGKKVLKQADEIRVVGERVKQSLLGLGVVESKFIVRPVQNDPELIKNYSSEINLHSKYPDYEKIFLVLGRLEPVKNITWIINVFKEVLKQKNYLLLIVGRGSEEVNIRNQIISNKLENNIKLQNWTEDPYPYLKGANCILFPSFSEGYGLVPMEANLLGTPVIMNDVGVANYELKPSDKVQIIPLSEKQKWIDAILAI